MKKLQLAIFDKEVPIASTIELVAALKTRDLNGTARFILPHPGGNLLCAFFVPKLAHLYITADDELDGPYKLEDVYLSVDLSIRGGEGDIEICHELDGSFGPFSMSRSYCVDESLATLCFVEYYNSDGSSLPSCVQWEKLVRVGDGNSKV